MLMEIYPEKVKEKNSKLKIAPLKHVKVFVILWVLMAIPA